MRSTTASAGIRRSAPISGGPDFLEIGEVMAAAKGGPPDLAAISEVMGRHGLTPAAPPAA